MGLEASWALHVRVLLRLASGVPDGRGSDRNEVHGQFALTEDIHTEKSLPPVHSCTDLALLVEDPEGDASASSSHGRNKGPQHWISMLNPILAFSQRSWTNELAWAKGERHVHLVQMWRV